MLICWQPAHAACLPWQRGVQWKALTLYNVALAPAFKPLLLHQALECRKLEQAEAKFQQAMDAAATDGARARVVRALLSLHDPHGGLPWAFHTPALA